MIREVDTNDLDLARHSQEKECIGYGRYLIDMGTTHGLSVLNALQRFLASNGFTCFPHRHGANIVDYVLAQPNFISLIKDHTVGPRPTGGAMDHALVTFTISFQFNATRMIQTPRHTRYTFTSRNDPIHKDGLYRCFADKVLECQLKELSEILQRLYIRRC